jgi:hypothetical protein
MLKMWAAIAALLLLLMLGSFFYGRYEKAHQFKTAGEFAPFLASMAGKDAQEDNDITLDYTPESIQTVEEILGTVHDHYVKNPSSVSANGWAPHTEHTSAKSSGGARAE